MRKLVTNYGIKFLYLFIIIFSCKNGIKFLYPFCKFLSCCAVGFSLDLQIHSLFGYMKLLNCSWDQVKCVQTALGYYFRSHELGETFSVNWVFKYFFLRKGNFISGIPLLGVTADKHPSVMCKLCTEKEITRVRQWGVCRKWNFWNET